jgi:hypothetical protein
MVCAPMRSIFVMSRSSDVPVDICMAWTKCQLNVQLKIQRMAHHGGWTEQRRVVQSLVRGQSPNKKGFVLQLPLLATHIALEFICKVFASFPRTCNSQNPCLEFQLYKPL